MTNDKNPENLDSWFPRQSPRLGVVVGGSLSKGLEVKLDIQADIAGGGALRGADAAR